MSAMHRIEFASIEEGRKVIEALTKRGIVASPWVHHEDVVVVISDDPPVEVLSILLEVCKELGVGL